MNTVVTGNFGFRIGNFVRQNGSPYVGGPEAAAYTDQYPDTVRAADYAIYHRPGIADPPPEAGYIPGLVPDLAVEIISPGYRSTNAIAERVCMWQDCGVRLVMIAHIATREIVTHGNDRAEHAFTAGDTLTLEPVLPGSTCPVVDMFAV